MSTNEELISDAGIAIRHVGADSLVGQVITDLCDALERAELVNVESGKMIRALTEELLHHRERIAAHLEELADEADADLRKVSSVPSLKARWIRSAAASVRGLRP